MMWRFKTIAHVILFLLLVRLSVVEVKAQGNDTSVFFRYASTFDQLMPSPYFPMEKVAPDSAEFELFGDTVLASSGAKIVTITHVKGDGSREENLPMTYKYEWDTQGRLHSSASEYSNSGAQYDITVFNYATGRKISKIYYSAMSKELDTVIYSYNRSGMINGWTRHVVTPDTNYMVIGTRLYDSRSRLVVATNMNYGPLIGSYIFEYNNENQLIRRAFTTAVSGVVLCTDTFEYTYQNDSRTLLQVNHKLKVAGMEQWVLIESKTINMASGKMMSYSDYNDADDNYYYRNYPSYTVRYEYDDKGRISGEYFGDLVNPDVISAKFYYGNNFAADSIVYWEKVIDRKATYSRVYSRDVRSFASPDQISDRWITTYLFEEKKKKDKIVPAEVVHISYTISARK
jgi:hypothetical protein